MDRGWFDEAQVFDACLELVVKVILVEGPKFLGSREETGEGVFISERV